MAIDATAILDRAAGEIDALAVRAHEDFRRLVGTGMTEAQALQIAMRSFEQNATVAITYAFRDLLQVQVTTNQVLAMTVGEVTLSRALYDNRVTVQREVRRIVQEHARGQVNAMELARRLYDGYNTPRAAEALTIKALPPRREIQELLRLTVRDPAARQRIEALQRQVGPATIRTAALRSAYEQMFGEVLDDASERRRDRALRQVIEERNRYFANRIAQTELARAHADRMADEFLADPTVEVVEWRMATTHPKTDICDLLAGQDAWGLGPGLYPKLKAPKPIAHPFCRCRLVSRPDVSAAGARENPGAARTFLRGLPTHEAARMVGSRAKLAKVLKGEDFLAIANRGRPDGYKIIALGNKGPGAGPLPGAAPVPPPVPPVAPVPVAPAAAPVETGLPQFILATTIAAAEAFAERVLNAPGGTAYVRMTDGTLPVRFHHDGYGSGWANAGQHLFGRAKFADLDIQTANVINEWLCEAQAKCDALGIPRLRGIRSWATSKFNASMGDGVLTIKAGRSVVEEGEALAKRVARAKAYNQWTAAEGSVRATSSSASSLAARPWTRDGYFEDPVEAFRSMLWHEFGHHVHQQFAVTTVSEYIGYGAEMRTPVEVLIGETLGKKRTLVYPTQYSAEYPTKRREYFAENFALYAMGRRDKVPQYMVWLFEQIERGNLPRIGDFPL